MKAIPEAYRSKDADQALAHVIEECGEFLAAAGKTQRFGANSYNPELPPEQREDNLTWLLRELGDLEMAIAALRTLLPLTT